MRLQAHRYSGDVMNEADWLAMLEDCLEAVMRERLALAKGYLAMPRKGRSQELTQLARRIIIDDLNRRKKAKAVAP